MESNVDVWPRIADIAVAGHAAGEKPETTGDLDEAIREHAEWLESGQDGREPSGDDFIRITTKLSSAARKALVTGRSFALWWLG
ncbi:MAG TPA: hypothetical protein VED84_05865 [Acidimicrobiales bacterium]|nr:hypothetical protein [Acidimicrobiales bacterium]